MGKPRKSNIILENLSESRDSDYKSQTPGANSFHPLQPINEENSLGRTNTPSLIEDESQSDSNRTYLQYQRSKAPSSQYSGLQNTFRGGEGSSRLNYLNPNISNLSQIEAPRDSGNPLID